MREACSRGPGIRLICLIATLRFETADAHVLLQCVSQRSRILFLMPTRRTFLVAGLAGGATLAAAWWLRGTRDAASPSPATAALSALDPQAPVIVGAIASVLLDGAIPADAAGRAAAVDATVANVARAVEGLPPSAQHELGQLFALLAFAPTRIALAGIAPSWREAPAADVAAMLVRFRDSRFALLRSAYAALHQLVFAAWYGDPASWTAIGYPGPPELS
jgi:hypothetical protein